MERTLANGADINGKGANLDYPPLVVAAGDGLVKMVKLLLRRGADIDVAAPRNVPCCSEHGCGKLRVTSGTTALHKAVKNGRLEVVRLLLRSGGAPNVVDSEGGTPLHVARFHGRADVVVTANTLLDAGADPLLPDAIGRLAIHFAARLGHTDLLNVLLLKAPTTLNNATADGFTPLWFAVINGRQCMVLHLLRLGAQQPVGLETQSTCPLVAAVNENHPEVLRILLDHGTGGVVGSAESITEALRSAVRYGRARSLDAILGHVGGEEGLHRFLARWRPSGSPVAHFAVSHGRLAILSVLLAAGADERATDGDGRGAHEGIASKYMIDPTTEAALVRMLERGPAFRASSWRWRARMSSPGGGELGALVALPGGGHLLDPLGVRIFRSKIERGPLKLLGRLPR